MYEQKWSSRANLAFGLAGAVCLLNALALGWRLGLAWPSSLAWFNVVALVLPGVSFLVLLWPLSQYMGARRRWREQQAKGPSAGVPLAFHELIRPEQPGPASSLADRQRWN